MFSKKLPACASVATLNKITVPTTLGTIVLLLTKIPNIIKTANEIKKAIPAVQQMINDLNKQTQTAPPQQVIEVSAKNPDPAPDEEVKVDMG